MGKFDPIMESRLLEAVTFRQCNPQIAISKIARQFTVFDHLLRVKLHGQPPANTKGGQNKALDHAQNDALKKYIDFLIFIGHQATKSHIHKAANSIL